MNEKKLQSILPLMGAMSESSSLDSNSYFREVFGLPLCMTVSEAWSIR